MSDLNVVVCVPGDQWQAGFGHSVSNMIAHFASSPYKGGEKSISLISVSGSMLLQLRTELVLRAIEADATHILFADDDMQFPADALHRLIAHNLPVVGCNYARRTVPPMPTAWGIDDAPVITDDKASGVQEVAHLGLGLVLVDVRCFALLRDKLGDDCLPWFCFEWKSENGRRYPEGEDVYFFRKLRSAGVPIMCDHDLSKQVQHIGTFRYENWQCSPEHAVQTFKAREAA